MKPMRLTSEYGVVTLSYDDQGGDRITRRFFCPEPRCYPKGHELEGVRLPGAYVKEILPNGRDTQVCDALWSQGPTLVSTPEKLPDLIRREYRRMRRSQAR